MEIIEIRELLKKIDQFQAHDGALERISELQDLVNQSHDVDNPILRIVYLEN